MAMGLGIDYVVGFLKGGYGSLVRVLYSQDLANLYPFCSTTICLRVYGIYCQGNGLKRLILKT